MSKTQVGGGTKALRESPVIPESKPHADPQPPAYDWSLFTINGQPIPQELWPNMNYHLTDQAYEERQKAAGPKPVVTVLRDADDKRLDTFKDGLKTNNLVLGSDPLKIAMDKHLPPGMRGLWIGAKKAEEAGLVRGVLEFTPVMIDDPEKPGTKKRVQQNGMFLAMVPEEHFKQAEAFYQNMADEKQRQTVEKVTEQTERILTDAGMKDLARKKRVDGSLLTGNIEVDDGDAADRELESLVPHEMAADL